MKKIDLKIKRNVKYSDLKEGDKVLIKNYNGNRGALIFQWRDLDEVCWLTDEGKEVYNGIQDLKDKKTEIVGVIL